MPNYCNNALEVNGSEEGLKVVETLFDGSIENRLDEVVIKMRKLLLAGIGGVLVPHTKTTSRILSLAKDLHAGLDTDKRGNDDKSWAYSEFLEALVEGSISVDNAHRLAKMYERTGVAKLWWGDISRDKRQRMKLAWKNAGYHFTSCMMNIDSWWSLPESPRFTNKPHVLDMRVLCELPLNAMVNGFNAGALNCDTTYKLNHSLFNTKWEIVDVEERDNGNYTFATAWSAATPLPQLVCSYVDRKLGVEDAISANIYYYESGNCFQGINSSMREYCEEYNEETDEWKGDMLEEISEAFGY